MERNSQSLQDRTFPLLSSRVPLQHSSTKQPGTQQYPPHLSPMLEVKPEGKPFLSPQARLLVIAQEQQLAAIAEIRGDLVKAEWGQQIRNYVFHPYKMVKDLRTGGVQAGGVLSPPS